MTIAELTPSLASEIAANLMEKISEEHRGFTSEERKVVWGLIHLVSAANSRELAEYWRENGELLNIRSAAKKAIIYFGRFEEVKAFIEDYLKTNF